MLNYKDIMPVDCTMCHHPLSGNCKLLACTGECRNKFHASCVVKKPDNKIDLRSFREWKCKNCKESADPFNRSGKTIRTPSPPSSTDKDNNMVMLGATSLHTSALDTSGMPEVSQMNMNDVLKEILIRQREMHQSMSFMNEMYERLLKDNSDLKTTIAHQAKVINEIQAENLILKNEVDNIAQYSRRNIVEVHGIKDMTNDSCLNILCAIARKIDMQIDEREIDTCHVINTLSSRPNKAVFKFVRKVIRDEFLEKCRKAMLSEKDVFMDSATNNRIYVNEQLSPHFRQLMGRANSKRKQLSWRYIWTVNGKIKVRKDNGTPVIVINSESDLDKITE